MLSVWWGVQGPIYWELLPEGTTITGDVYARQLRDLKAHVQSTPWLRGRLHFLHDNARPHVCKQVKKELTTFGWHIVPHAPYSPDMAPSDYWLFSDRQRVLGETLQEPRGGRRMVEDLLRLQAARLVRRGNP